MLLLEQGGGVTTRQQVGSRLWQDHPTADLDRSINAVVRNLRKALGDSVEQPRYIETLSGQGYRLVVSPEWARESDEAVEDGSPQKGGTAEAGSARTVAKAFSEYWRVVIPLILASVIGVWFSLHRRAHQTKLLSIYDTVVLSEFTNSTGDPVFDGTLRQGLSAQLEQSPFFHLLPNDSIAQTLSLMSQPKGARLTPELARELCQRTQSAATIDGSIAKLGAQYVVGLRATSCSVGELLADKQGVASDKEHVLRALDETATSLRRKLGESLASVQTYDVPLEHVTTPSLEALRNYSLGIRALDGDNFLDAAGLAKRATDLDPNFAMAYMLQAVAYGDLSENERATEAARMAYKLRDRLSQREKLMLEAHYMDTVTGNIEEAQKSYQVWAEIYPRDGTPVGQLGNGYLRMGEYDQAVGQFKKVLEMYPAVAMEYVNVAQTYLFLNRPDEAEATIRDARARHLESRANNLILYQTAYLRHDAAALDQEKSHLLGHPGYEDQVWEFESDSAAYTGHFRQARELSERAADSAWRADEKEVTASYVAESALRDALVGNVTTARQQAKAALAQSSGVEVEAMAAIALALTGDSVKTDHLMAELNRRFPEDTTVQLNYLPVIRAAAVLQHNPAAALQAIAPAQRYELGFVANGANFNGYPIYFRAEALLANGQGALAATAFQKILDHPGVVMNSPIAALAYVGLARAYVLMGDKAKARAAYRNFVALWRDADPEIPIYREAKVEYADVSRMQ